MNADVVLTEQALGRLLKRMENDPQVAVVGPRIMSGGTVQPSARAFPSLRTGLFGRRSLATRMLLRAGRLPTELKPAHGNGGFVDWVSGACMLIRAEAFWQVGGFDEEFWMYWEDADLCRRLADRGWRVAYEPSAIVHHATGASGSSERTIRAFHDSAARFAARHIAATPLQGRIVERMLRARTTLVLRRWANRRRRD
jgi:GT2 family glycosyltransferase